jgi:hypothetical protein
MNTTLDGQEVFDKQQSEIEVGSFSRDSIERAVPGLDGTLSIDMGRRSRKITQTGTLRAKSRTHLDDRITAISHYMDGNTHSLITIDGRQFDNVRMDTFKVKNERADGACIVVDYEITYTQLA